MIAKVARQGGAADVAAAINAGIDSYETSSGTQIARGVRIELVAHIQATVRRLVLQQFVPSASPARHWSERE